ncbi:hypothetical protein Cgig2_005255 [Carnegiea gigantea]|uniref:Peptidase metallopeptidase domain-containing protein n=1 Tax=Carnegiea gigantea TaxID=171969 RepID=A0A9Q1K349_9CARY|nr:hypothetical protein Cgig2_005255 [Carnegiea gigantea]
MKLKEEKEEDQFMKSCVQPLPKYAFRLQFKHSTVVERNTSASTVDLTIDATATWHNFSKFLDLEKGTQLTGVSDLKKYFHRFGYLPSPPVNFTDVFDSSLESAVSHYQSKLGLPVTGKIDAETLHLIMTPRCGVSDSHSHAQAAVLRQTRRFEYFNGRPRWVKPAPVTLTYAFSADHTVGYISKDEIRAVFSRAFARWARVIPMNFTEVEKYSTADVKIGFYRGDHGDGEPFDGVLGVLAHAFSPESGKLHLDGAETWAVDFRKERSRVAVDLESVVTHEIGHVLGLAHSTVKDSIMYPNLSPRTKKVNLRIDDVEGIQALYGSNPNFELNSLLSEEFSDNNGCRRGGAGLWWWLWVASVGLVQMISFML